MEGVVDHGIVERMSNSAARRRIPASAFSRDSDLQFLDTQCLLSDRSGLFTLQVNREPERSLLDISQLLPDIFERVLRTHNRIIDIVENTLRSDGVNFATDLLAYEIQAFADCAVFATRCVE